MVQVVVQVVVAHLLGIVLHEVGYLAVVDQEEQDWDGSMWRYWSNE